MRTLDEPGARTRAVQRLERAQRASIKACSPSVRTDSRDDEGAAASSQTPEYADGRSSAVLFISCWNNRNMRAKARRADPANAQEDGDF